MPDITPFASAVDLSRLPAPTIIEQLSFEQIFAAMVARVQTLMPTFDATVESDPAVKVLQACAYRELLMRQDFNERLVSFMVAFATEGTLDHLAALVGVARLVLVAADEEAGTDAVMESDDALRERIVLAPESFTVAGPEAAYIFHARSASGDVLDASATSPDPGEVVVSVLSRTGDGAASPELVAAVAAVVNADGVRPLTDHVTVQSADIVDYRIEAELTLFTGPDAGIVLDTAQARAEAYRDAMRRLGRDITLSGIYAALHVEGVQRVALIDPPADVVVTRLQAASCTEIVLTVAGNGE